MFKQLKTIIAKHLSKYLWNRSCFLRYDIRRQCYWFYFFVLYWLRWTLIYIFKYFTCSFDTLNMGISKFKLIGPISFLAWVVFEFFKVIFAINVCSYPPLNFFIVHSPWFSTVLCSAVWPYTPFGISNVQVAVSLGRANLAIS